MFIENFWLFVFVVMCVGGILGFAFFSLRYRNSERIRRLQEELQAKTEELESYRGDVGEHFLKTAELVDNLTQSYKSVYDHLEGSAYKLVGEEDFRKQIADRKLQLGAFSAGTPRELGAGGAAAVVIDEEITEDVAENVPQRSTKDVTEVRAQGSVAAAPNTRAGKQSSPSSHAAPGARPVRVVRAEEVEDETLSRS